MERLALILSIMWLTGCAASDQSSPVLTPVSIDFTPLFRPSQLAELPEPQTIENPPAIPPIVTKSIGTATAVGSAPTPAPVARLEPTATSTSPACPPLPVRSEVKTQAAVQYFEHGLMFWLHDRDEIWILIASPLKDQFYWRVLPNLWAESQPEVDLAVQPPAGRFQPRRGFGYAWRLGGGSFGSQRVDLGWAIDEEAGFDATLIYYPQGFYSPDCTWMPKSGIYGLTDERGTIYQFVGAGGIARVVMP